ncbi:High-affinity carbon uptake protein Hat/HatR [Azospirillum argentinense]
MGGIGKTTLAADLCRDSRVAAAFPGGILWLTLGEAPDVVTAQRRLIHWIGGTPTDLRDATEGRDRLSALFAERDIAYLIVLDDLWELAHQRDLLPADCPHQVLITTRRSDLLRTLNADEQRVEEMSPAVARSLLAACAHRPEAQLPDLADRIVGECGRLPLALAIVGALLKDGDEETWRDVLEALRAAEHDGLLEAELPDYRRARHVFGALAVSVEHLDQEARDRFADLAAFPEDIAIPVSVFDRLWSEDVALKRRRWLSLFIDRNLARRTAGNRITLHDLQRDYLVTVLARNDLVRRHRKMLEGYQKAGDEYEANEYGFEWLPWHLHAANDTDRLRSLLLDPTWMYTKMLALGVASLHRDYLLLPKDDDVQRAGDALRLSAHVLVKDPHQLASQLWGRLPCGMSKGIDGLLDQAAAHAKRPWLKPRRPTLMPPGGALLRTLTGHSLSVCAVAALPDGRHALSASTDRTLRLWNLDTGTELAIMRGHSNKIQAVAVLLDGHRAVSGSDDKTVKLWDLDTGACLATLEGHSDRIRAIAVLPDGRRILTASEDDTLKLWDVDTGATLATLMGHYGTVRAVAVLPDGCRAISVGNDRTLKLWDLDTGEVQSTLRDPSERITAVAVLPDGHRALSGSTDGTLKLWDLDAGATLAILRGHGSCVTAVAVLPDGSRALSTSDDKTLKLWDLDTSACLATLQGHSDGVRGLAVLPDGCRALSASDDGTLKLWNLGTDVAPTLSTSDTHILELWDLDTDADLASLQDYEVWRRDAAKLARGIRAVSASNDEPVKLPDGRRAISVAQEGWLKLRDLNTGEELAVLHAHPYWEIRAVAPLPDGRRALSASDDKTVKLWDLDTSTEIVTLNGHSGWVNAVAMLPDGRHALSASDDGTLRVWDLDCGVGRVLFTAEAQLLRCSVSGSLVVAGDNLGRLHVFDFINTEDGAR